MPLSYPSSSVCDEHDLCARRKVQRSKRVSSIAGTRSSLPGSKHCWRRTIADLRMSQKFTPRPGCRNARFALTATRIRHNVGKYLWLRRMHLARRATRGCRLDHINHDQRLRLRTASESLGASRSSTGRCFGEPPSASPRRAAGDGLGSEPERLFSARMFRFRKMVSLIVASRSEQFCSDSPQKACLYKCTGASGWLAPTFVYLQVPSALAFHGVACTA